MTLEEMGSFFNARTDSYEQHMLDVLAGREDYRQIAALIPPEGEWEILDLGCGTGLELDEIFKVNPNVRVTGIDLAEKMLQKLKSKHAARLGRINIIVGDYLARDFGRGVYDIALSVQTLHHFTHEEKAALYRRLIACLKPEGFYIEGDYVAPTQEFEDYHFAEKKRILTEQKLNQELYHYDTPCTVENQKKILKQSGFASVQTIWESKNFAILKADK
jgi:tRNA (cmo5U34)-methyltransferase